MGQISQIPTIKRLADKFGTRLVDTDTTINGGEGIAFIYSVNGEEVTRTYNIRSRGIDEEITLLNRLIQLSRKI